MYSIEIAFTGTPHNVNTAILTRQAGQDIQEKHINSSQQTVRSKARRHAALMLFALAYTGITAVAQDTFSIVVVDTVTGEIGSAGASCVGPLGGVGAFIISDVIEGRGAIHTQASYLANNQANARNRMLLGESPQQIINWLVANDAGANSTTRQYGIVDLTRGGESAGFTGINCTDYKSHATGPGYAVQGNILLGQHITDTIKNVYLSSPGPLADRLMNALAAARIVGADTRCASRGTSSRSAFVKVVRIGDGGTPYLQVVVPDSPVGTDPIDLVLAQFQQWKDTHRTIVDPFLSTVELSEDTLLANGMDQATITVTPKNNSDSAQFPASSILIVNSGGGTVSTFVHNGDGSYAGSITAPAQMGTDTLHTNVVTGGDTVRLSARPVIVYTAATSVGRRDGAVRSFLLEQNYPNPFNPETTISYGLPTQSTVTITVTDILGQQVALLRQGTRQPGFHSVQWDAAAFPTGIYFYRIDATCSDGTSFSDTKRMILLK